LTNQVDESIRTIFTKNFVEEVVVPNTDYTNSLRPKFQALEKSEGVQVIRLSEFKATIIDNDNGKNVKLLEMNNLSLDLLKEVFAVIKNTDSFSCQITQINEQQNYLISRIFVNQTPRSEFGLKYDWIQSYLQFLPSQKTKDLHFIQGIIQTL